MPYSPLVLKIRVHNPNKKGTVVSNRNNLIYIATRAGVALDGVNSFDDLVERDISEKISEVKIHEEASDEGYVRYMARRNHSHGLFGNIDTEDLNMVARKVSDISKDKRIVYRGIISLSEKDGEALGFRNSESWNNYLKKVMPDIAKELGISTIDHTWVAAFHSEETHPHVHFELWDNQKRIKSPFIHKETQKKIRNFLSDEMFSNSYERMIRETYKDELEELKLIRNNERDTILDISGNFIDDIGYTPGVVYERLPERIPDEILREICFETNKFIAMLPENGRLAYKFLSPDAKAQLTKITELVMDRVDIKRELSLYLDAVDKMHQLYGETKTEITKAVKAAKTDIEKRIKNRIITDIKSKILNVEAISEIRQKTISSNEIDAVTDFDKQNEYHVSWSKSYKKAMKMIFAEELDERSIVDAFDLLEKEAINKNVIAMEESAKLIEKMLVPIESFEAEEYYREAAVGYKDIFNDPSVEDYLRSYAAYREGKLVIKGNGIAQDYDEADLWLGRAGDNKHAQYTRGILYLHNKVTTELDDLKRIQFAKKLFESSAEKTNPYASYELAKLHEQGLDGNVDKKKSEQYYSDAFTGFENMLDKGTNDNLLYRVGQMLYVGKGTAVDIERAMVLIEKSAKLGNENAQFLLAKHYLSSDISKVSEAITLLEKLAANGNDRAQYQLGKIYLDPENELHDLQKAIGYLVQSAEQGNQFAQYQLGKVYLDPESELHDLQKAIGYLGQSAEQGNQFAQYQLGKVYLDPENELHDLQKAIGYLEQSAEQGNQFAQYQLGKIYLNPESELHDLQKAIGYLDQSAEQGNQFAQYQLGKIYLDPETDMFDLQKAIGYLEQSAEQGNQFAQYQLGKIYLNPESELHDLQKAIGYLDQSAEQGNQFAQYQLGKIYLDPETDMFDLQKAAGYLDQSAEQGNQFAQYQLGKIYLDPENELHDLQKAIGYLDQSAEQGNQFAQYQLGKIYLDPENELHDLQKAIGYLDQSAEQGNQFAQYQLGKIYLNPESELHDLQKAIGYLEQSAEQGNQFAQYQLGKIYLEPKLGVFDPQKGITYLEKSAEQDNKFAYFQLGNFYSDRERGFYNSSKAIEYFLHCTDSDFATYKIGAIYSDKTSNSYNIEKGINYLTISAEKGNEHAQAKLGCIYYFGLGIDKNKELGEYWLNKASAQGNEFARSVLENATLDYPYIFAKAALQMIDGDRRKTLSVSNENHELSKQAKKEKALHHKEKNDEFSIGYEKG